MVTAPDVPAAETNREIINRWVQRWTLAAIDGLTPLGALYEGLPAVQTSLAGELSAATAAQNKVLAELGLEGVA